jgi:hypothetical protein
MRVLIDTNILISAAYAVGSTPHRAYIKAVTPPNVALICEQSIEKLATGAKFNLGNILIPSTIFLNQSVQETSK